MVLGCFKPVLTVLLLLALEAERLSALPPAMEGSDIRARHEFPDFLLPGVQVAPQTVPYFGIVQDPVPSGPYLGSLLDCQSFLSLIISWRLPNQILCSFRGKAHTPAISHPLSSSGNKNWKLSSDLKLLDWQPARRCHQPQ